MKKLLVFLFVCVAASSYGQTKSTPFKKFKPPVVQTFLGVNQDGAAVMLDEGVQLVALPLKITDAKGNNYSIDSYQFLYRRETVLQNENTGKPEVGYTIVSSRFHQTPLPKVWVDNIKPTLKKGEQLYFFDIMVKDKEGRTFMAPEIKITIK